MILGANACVGVRVSNLPLCRRMLARSAILLVLLLHLPGCSQGKPAPLSPREQQLIERIDSSLALASNFLVQRQGPDGAWRSRVYGGLKDGPSLTPHVLTSLYFLQQGGEQSRASFRRGVAYLSTLLNEDGRVDAALRYPVYNAAVASWVVVLGAHDQRSFREQAAWIEFLRARQLDGRLGWSQSDPEFGGWGYSVRVPRKPGPGEERDPLAESNISATGYALGAMRCSNVPPSDPVYGEILTFVQRCQNYSDDPGVFDSRFDDGGFFFMPRDAAKNKAGSAGVDRAGRGRFHSYGGATADGLRALLHAGLPIDHPRVIAARRWLESHFDANSNPGTFEPDREVLRNATYYYYIWSAAHAFMHLGVRQIHTGHGSIDWAEAVATELLDRQRSDGSWVNRYTDTKEDDPLVATPSAAAALAICRKVICESHSPHGSQCHHVQVARATQ